MYKLLRTLLAQQCWGLLRPLARAQTFDRVQTFRNNSPQQHATTCNRVCKRAQHVTSNNVGSCWPTIGSLTSNWFRLAKQQLYTCITLFCTFLCSHSMTKMWKCLISRFVANVNTRQRLCFSFPQLRYSPLEFTPRKIANIADEFNELERAPLSLKQPDITF